MHKRRMAFFRYLLFLMAAPAALAGEFENLEAKIFANLSPPGTRAGTVLASPQRGEPDYYFHWVRDGALTMNTVFDILNRRGDDAEMIRRFTNYTELSRLHQATPTLSSLGEPKFHVDGSAFNEEWCRPQNDSPALRAIALLRYVNWADQKKIFAGSDEVIRKDLDYIADNWRKPTCDLWEEVMGEHFYTRMVQRKALIEGAKQLERRGDTARAQRYRGEAKALEKEIMRHWDAKHGYFLATLNPVFGPEKPSSMDAAVILGILHGHTDDGFLNFADAKVLKTAAVLEGKFRRQYPINNRADIPGIGIGRYPEDLWNGSSERSGANPWFLLTSAFSRYYRLAAAELALAGHPRKALRLAIKADEQLARAKFHAGEGGRMDEQFSRDNGFLLSARDLTWSYAETLEAEWAREDHAICANLVDGLKKPGHDAIR